MNDFSTPLSRTWTRTLAGVPLQGWVILLGLCGFGLSALGAATETAPQARWAHQFGQSGFDQPVPIFSVDPFGSVYFACSQGASPASVVKVNRSGQREWVRSENNVDQPAVVVDRSGQVRVLYGLAGDGQSVSLAGTNLSGAVGMVAYDADGNVQWARTILHGNAGQLYPLHVGVGPENETYWALFFNGTVQFGTNSMTTGGHYGAAVIKCDADAGVEWVRVVASNFSVVGGMAIDPSGNVVLSASYEGAGVFGSTNLPGSAARQQFVAKLTPDGQISWLIPITIDETPYVAAPYVAVDPAGNSFVGGYFSQPGLFGATPITPAQPTNMAYLVKLSPSGEVQWVRQPGQADAWCLVATDDAGNCICHARYYNTTWMYKYDPAGQQLWSRPVPGQLRLGGMRTDGAGNSYLLGSFTGSILLCDSLSLTNSGSSSDFALVKFDTTTPPRLQIAPAGNSLRLSWPVLATDFVLESTTDVASASWSSNSNSSFVQGAFNVVMVPITAGREFFRLRR
jgi:hypothetical protein